MRTVLVFLGAFIVSLFVSQFVAVPLAIQFNAREEFIGVMVALVLFAFISVAVLAVVFALAANIRPIDLAAVTMAAIAVVCVGAALGLSSATGGRRADEFALSAEFLAPALVTVLIQWWLVRRRWLKIMRLGAT